MQLQEYSCVGILRQYNKYFTSETFCIELLSVVIVRKYHGSSTVPSLSSPDMSSKEEPDFHAKSRFRKVLRVHTNLFVSLAPQVLQTNSGRLGDLPKKIPGVSNVQIFHNRVSSSWCFRENPTDDRRIPPSIHHNRSFIKDFAPKVKRQAEKIVCTLRWYSALHSSITIVLLVYNENTINY